MSLSQLEARYQRLCATPSSINELLPILREYSSKVESVAEFGVDIGQSTTAFLMGQPKHLFSIDIIPCPALQELLDISSEWGPFNSGGFAAKVGPVYWEFRIWDSRIIDLPPVDLLFIDSAHCYDQLSAELTRHHRQVRKWIALHDVVAFGTYGEAGPPQLGLTPAIDEFLAHHPEWVKLEEFKNNNGLLILERQCPSA